MPQTSGPTGTYRVVQVHPLLRCNLRCLHCYSESSPRQLATLAIEPLCRALETLREEGFNGVGVSGGEPLMYSELRPLLEHVRSLGMIATVTTNGMLIDDARASMLQELTDLVAISIDGPPDAHNTVRAHPRAFDHMERGIAYLKNAGVPFGLIFTLTQFNLDQISWIAEYAVSHGAGLFQVHPLEEVGRASGSLPGAAPDALELARAFVEVARLQAEYAGRLVIQYDVADLGILSAHPERGFAAGSCACVNAPGARFADVIAPVIVEADGAIVPLQYNFSRAFQIGNVHVPDLKGQLDTWRRERFDSFLALCSGVYNRERA